jgi:hypothetical protein
MTWHSGSTLYSTSSGAGFTYRPSDGYSQLKHGTIANTYLTHDTNGALIAGNTNKRTAGMYGTYDSNRTAHIWSMGIAYKISDTGANFGSLYGLAYKHTNNTTGGTMAGGHQAVWCQNGTGTAAIGTGIWTSGNVTAYSDIRVKINIERIDDALEKVKKLNGYTFDRTDVDIPRQTGVIAQEVLEVLPEAVTGGPTENDPDNHYSVAYGNMVGLLIESVKELDQKVNDNMSCSDTSGYTAIIKKQEHVIEELNDKVEQLSELVKNLNDQINRPSLITRIKKWLVSLF